MRNVLLFSLLTFILTSCGPTIYKTTDFNSVAQKHKIVAIIPALVTIQLRPNEARRTTPEQLAQNESATGYAVQEKMYGWFLRRSSQHPYTVQFQDVSETNALLHKANINYEDLRTASKAELAKLLGVDAVISTSVRTEKPMSEGVALALGAAFGVWGSTNNAITTINIHEGGKGNLMWKYDYQAAGALGSSPGRLVNALMRNASKKFPYSSKS